MQLKLILIKDASKQIYFFNETDSRHIINLCQKAGKQWSKSLLGFFINTANNTSYAAITIKTDDGMIESMEYVDVDTRKPEFTIDSAYLLKLAKTPNNSEISLDLFEPILSEILFAPVKARRFEVYNEISEQYLAVH